MVRTIQVLGFPSTVSIESVKKYLENYVGTDAIVDLTISQSENGAKGACAVVLFGSENDAAQFLTSNKKYSYGFNDLEVKKMEKDVIPKKNTYQRTIKQVMLKFGCQVSGDNFLVLWEERGVVLEVGFGRKLYFYVVHSGTEYRLELSCGDIRQIQQRRSHGYGCRTKDLLIELSGAPRIFKKVESSTEDNFAGSPPRHCKEDSDDQYVRTTDFTDSLIGQSSGLCLRMPYYYSLSYFKEKFPNYKKNDEQFILDRGRPFSINMQFVPLVAPERARVYLPFPVFFKVNMLIQNGCLSGPTLGTRFFHLLDPEKVDISFIDFALEKLFNLKECCYDPASWLIEQYRIYNASKRPHKNHLISLDDGLVYIRRVQVTPCRVYFCGPEVSVSNRVLRMYRNDIDNFIRVSFVDENLEKLHSADLSPRVSCGSEDRRNAIYWRIVSTLQHGIRIGDKHFEFLAFSSSQLRDNSLWMFASRPGLSADKIRRRLGDFSQIKNVAKYAARLGLSLGSSTETFIVKKDEMESIPDIENVRGLKKYVFSDGIGKISLDFAREVARKCVPGKQLPSAYQIRYAGYKGVVAIDPTSTTKLSLRKSMCKFVSWEQKLDVLAVSKYQPCFLNRQLITLLSTLGVEDYVFEKKQREVVDRLDAILTGSLIAREVVDQMSPGENSNIIKHMLDCGYMPNAEPFLSMMLLVFRTTRLMELRTKTRIFIPKGSSMMGCLDETRSLEYGQVFLQASSSTVPYGSEHNTRIIKGKVVVAKNPCLHPGDVRVLQAVDVPALHHMVDCVVFPQKGKRPHPNECSGSDLDGDVFFVSWDPDLIPPKVVKPMDYTPPRAMELDHKVTIEKVQKYFADYIVSDTLGVISSACTVFADKEPAKAMSKQCKELARLFSVAVDFNKTGTPAKMRPQLYVKEYPDFMEKSDKPTYESPNVIGKLFREIKDKAPLTFSSLSFTREVAQKCYDQDMEYPGFKDHLDDAVYYKTQYDFKLGNLMDYYGIKSEAEIFSGNIMKLSTSFDRRKDLDSISVAVRALKKEAGNWLNGKGTVYEFEELCAKASAWYHVTYHPDYWGRYNEGLKRDHFISFPWCVYGKLVYIKKQNTEIRSCRDHIPSRDDQMNDSAAA